MIETQEYANGTSITLEYPWGIYRSARVLCPDGKARKVSRVSATADTFFSVPCAVQVRRAGKRFTVAGYLTVQTREGFSVATPEDPAIVRFIPYKYRKNHAVFGVRFDGDDEEDHCRQCGAATDDGEGYDGLCGNCADKAADEE